MSEFDRETFLARTWLSGMPRRAVADAASCAYLRRLSGNQRVFSRGDPPGPFYVIVSGQVRIRGDIADGEEMILNDLGEGMAFGEVAILDGQPRTQDAECLGPTTLLAISESDFRQLLDRHPVILRRVTQQLCGHLRSAFSALEDQTRLKVDARLARRLVSLSQSHGVPASTGIKINLYLSHEVLARMLGATRQSVSRTLSDWQRAGWIRQDYSRITICDEAALSATAGPAGA